MSNNQSYVDMNNDENNNASLIEFAKRYLDDNSDTLIAQFEYNGQRLWIKRRPFSKKKLAHRLQGVIASLFCLPIFYPTVSTGGAQSLFDEAERLNLFATRHMPVPRVMAVTPDFLITNDVGQQLHRYLQQLTQSEAVHLVLLSAVGLLNQLHREGLCHGRPSFGDMTIQDNVISLIDLEENPLEVMTLAEAQARDVWLFFLNAARYCPKDGVQLVALFNSYRQGISSDTLQALQKMVNKLKPLRVMLEYLGDSILGRDGSNAIRVNKALECVYDAIL